MTKLNNSKIPFLLVVVISQIKVFIILKFLIKHIKNHYMHKKLK